MVMELLQLFDINENIINKKIPRGIEPDNDEYIMIVYVFIMYNNKLLLEKNTKYNKWVIPGGHVISNNPLEDIKRECYEELGIDIDINNLELINTLNNNNRFFKLYYLNQNKFFNDIIIQKEEVSDFDYFEIDTINKMINNNLIRDNNIVFFKEFKKFIDKRDEYNE